MNGSSPLPVRLEEQRTRAIEALCSHFAHDHLTAEQLERLLDAAHRVTTPAELDGLLADLPALPTSAAADELHPALAEPSNIRDRQVVAAVMGGAERKGVWTPAREVYAIAWMGGIGLDFREAHFARGVTNVNVLAIMGGVEILVPPGLRVECEGLGVMGGFDGYDQRGGNHPEAPTLRINGLAIMGGVEVVDRLPGESARQAKIRRRQQRKQLWSEHEARREGGR